MKTLNEYMNDPSVTNEPVPMREVHAIRLMIYDETKDMDISEQTAYFNRNIAELKNNGFKVIPSAKKV